MQAVQSHERELREAIESLVSSSKAGPYASGVLSRLTKTFVRELLSIEPQKLERLPPSMDDHELLAYIVLSAFENEPLASKEGIMKVKGRMAFRSLLAKNGGVLSQQQVADLLGIQKSGVRKRVERKKLLVVKQGDHYVFPAFQFGNNGETLPNFADLLQLLETDSDVAQVRFFLSAQSDLGKSIAQALKDGDDLEPLKRKARTFGKQGAT